VATGSAAFCDESAKVSNVCGDSVLIFPSRAQIGYALKECGFNEKRDSTFQKNPEKKKLIKSPVNPLPSIRPETSTPTHVSLNPFTLNPWFFLL